MNKIKTILDKVVSALSGISGIQAVVLGGSRARGTHSSESDIDIGIYYDKDTLDLMSLNKAAKLVDDEHRDNLVVPPGEWGKWVNGGGWLVIDGYHVDLILRDAERVKNVISECQEGNVSAHYQTGHPHAYMNVMYMGELAVCKMLWDKQGNISALKRVAEQFCRECAVPKLRHMQYQRADARCHRSRPITVPITASIVAALIRLRI